jgi:hypothetical protein
MNTEDKLVWAMFFANLVGIQFHPRNDCLIDEDIIRELAMVADIMLAIYRERE